MRRATNGHEQAPYKVWISIHALLAESDYSTQKKINPASISIHALLAESDRQVKQTCQAKLSISIHALLAESDTDAQSLAVTTLISIHALLAESDEVSGDTWARGSNFYPRSPCGERQERYGSADGTCRFLSTLSLRRATHYTYRQGERHAFLSTLSLRRATICQEQQAEFFAHFYPRSPCGERRWLRCWQLAARDISIHALLAESDKSGKNDCGRS